MNDADVSARVTAAQFQTGFVAQNEVLDAQVEVLNAREQLAASDAQLRRSTAALFKALGGGWSEAAPCPGPRSSEDGCP